VGEGDATRSAALVKRRAVGVAGVEAIIDDVAEPLGLGRDLLQKAADALRGMNLALPQDGVQKTVSQSVAFVHAVVVAGHAVAGQFIANQILPPRIDQPRGELFGDAQPMIGLAQQQRAAIGRNPLVSR
jgi:hypothetical protein